MIEQILRECCNGSEDAYDFCRTIYEHVHILDDVIDEPQKLSPDSLVHNSLKLMDMCYRNEFFRAHYDKLAAVMRCTWLDWVASERMRKSEDLKNQMAAEVLKSQYQNLFFEVAGLCGGFHHQRAMEAKWRHYVWG